MEITSILKLISLLVAAGFAILGTTVDYKKEGQVTKWGRIAIVGVIVSGLVSAVLLGVEETNKAEAKRVAEKADNDKKQELNQQFANLVDKAEKNITTTTQTLDKTNEVAHGLDQSVTDQKNLMEQTQGISGGVNKSVAQQGNILDRMQGQVALQQKTLKKAEDLQKQQAGIYKNTLRSLTPFKNFALFYQLELPLDTPELQPFVTSVKNFMNNIIGEHPKKSGRYTAQGTTFTLDGSTLKDVDIELDSPFFQIFRNNNIDNESLTFLYFSSPSIKFVKSDDNSKIPDLQSDLWLSAESSGLTEILENIKNSMSRSSIENCYFEINVDFTDSGPFHRGKKITILIKTDLIETISASEQRKILSFSDLPNSEMRIEIPCGAKISFFKFLTGENYKTEYLFPKRNRDPKKDRDFKYYNIGPRAFESSCRASFVFNDSDFSL